MVSKTIGGILLLVGTSIGGAILVLPLATASAGFTNASLLFIAAWLLMTYCSFLLLEANLWLPAGTNLGNMVKVTLGKPGVVITWVFYLFLLYTLLCAYISAGADVFGGLLAAHMHALPHYLSASLFTLIIGLVVFTGIRNVDWLNRLLMFTKLGILIVLISLLFPHVNSKALTLGNPLAALSSITVIITSFSFAVIIPSLRLYLDSDINSLRRSILIGSIIPLICYLLWEAVIIGVIPSTGDHGLIAISHSHTPTSNLLASIRDLLKNRQTIIFAEIFASLSVVTSFLGVSLSLSDFITDGLCVKRNLLGSLFVFSLTYGPPFFITLLAPNLFVISINYAGLCCIVLHIFLPIAIVWQGRYRSKLAYNASYRTLGGKGILAICFLLGLATMIIDIYLLLN